MVQSDQPSKSTLKQTEEKEDGSRDNTFLLKSSDNLPTAHGLALFVTVLHPRFLLCLAPARATAGGIMRSSSRGELDEFHTKRRTQDVLGLIKHGLECAPLRADHFFRDLVAAEGHAPLLIKEREPNQIGRAFFQVLFMWSRIKLKGSEEARNVTDEGCTYRAGVFHAGLILVLVVFDCNLFIVILFFKASLGATVTLRLGL